jgi:hypothetical protein
MSRFKKRKNNKNLNQNTEKIIMNTDNPLFDYINPKNNDKFSEMSGIDLQDLLYYIENYYLELRNRLGFDDYITFGLELEFENTMINHVINKLNEYHLANTWKLKSDGSLTNGAEINSPILKDKSDSWNNLKKVCYIINENATIGTNSGGHIHIGTQVIGGKEDSWLNFIKLWSVYENIIYRFVYGDFLSARPCMSRYAEPMTKDFWKDYQTLKEYDQLKMRNIITKISHKRYQAVNFNNVSDFNNMSKNNTIEFRCPNGTIDPVVWQNNVNLFVNVLLYSKSSGYNDDIIQKRRNINEEKYSSLNWYGEIYLQQALELCDMLFTNNFDKVYFLRQYLKSFEIGNKELSKPKPFTRNLSI